MNYILGNQPETKEAEKKEKEIKIEKEEINSEHENAIKVKKHFLFEDKSKREPNAKHYVGNDGTTTAVYSAKAVHFSDGESSGLSEIDNSLSDDGETFQTKANSFKTRFKKRSADGEIFEVADGKCKVGLKSRDLSKHCGCDADNCICEHSDCAESSLIFKDVTPNVDLQYSVDSDRVKENIIIKEKCDNYEYDFGMNIENLETCISDDGKTLQLKDTDSGKVKFYIPAPFMIDAAGAKSELVCYEIAEQSEGSLEFKVVADKDWINSEERKFPVKIDPQIVASDTSLFTYENYTQVEKEGSNGAYWSWERSEIKDDNIIIDAKNKLILKINKSKYQYLTKRITSVKLKFDGYSSNYDGHCPYISGCKINGNFYNLIYGINYIDITSLFKLYSVCTLEFTSESYCYTRINLGSGKEPQLIIEYMTNENEAEPKTFSLAGDATGSMDLETGAFTTSFSDIEAGSSALPLQIAHTHLKSDDDFNCGENWRLNLHQKLEKSGDEYVYADGNGRKHMITEVYYYVDGSSRKTVNKSEVTINPNGLLSCNVNGVTYEVTRELRTNEGLRLVTRLEDVNNIEFYEQRQENELQLENEIYQLKDTISELSYNIGVYKDKLANTGSPLLLYDNSNNIVDSLINSLGIKVLKDLFNLDNEIGDNNDNLMQRLENVDIAIAKLSITSEREIENLYYEFNNIEVKEDKSNQVVKDAAQINAIKQNLLRKLYKYKNQLTERFNNSTLGGLEPNKQRKASRDYTVLNQMQQRYEKYSIQLKQKNEQLKQLKRQLPTAYVTDDSGKILCFNCFGNLCAITDRYENVISVEWNEIITSEGKKEVITAVYDGERKTAFKYNRDGKLISITAPDGNRVAYTYSINELKKVKFSDGKINYFRYSSNNIARIRCNDHTLSEIKYNGYIPKSITTNSTVTEVTDSTETVAESNISDSCSTSENLLSSVQIIFEPNYISISDGNTTEYTLLDENKRTCGGYTKKNGEVSGLNFYSRADRMYEFRLTPKKTADIIRPNVSSSSIITSYLGVPPVINTLPDMTNEYSDYREASWELVTLDDFNRPKSAETGWQITRGANGNIICTKTYVTYEYAAGEPDYNCLKKTITEYTNLNGTASTSGAEKKVYVEEYSYCEHGNLVKTESYVEGEEGTNGITVTEKVCDEKGNIVKEFTYNTLDSTTKFYKESEVAEDGKVTAEIDETGENRTRLIYNDGTETVNTRILPNGSKVSYSYDESGRVTGITQSTESGEENSTSIKYTLGLPTRLTSGNNVVYYEYDNKRRLRKVTLNGTETNFIVSDNDEIEVTIKDGVIFRTVKDKDGNVIRTELNESVQTERVYEDGLLKSVKDNVAGTTTNYEYNPNRTLRKISNGQVTEEYTYNERNEITGKKITSGETTHNYKYSYKENAAREIDYIEMPYGVRSYVLRDVNGRYTGRELKSGTGNKVYGEYISYRKVGDRATNMPSAVWYANGNVIRDNVKYKYDDCGNIVEIRENGKLTARYEYDGLNRLVREDNKKLGKTWVYGYDRNGNITVKREYAFTLRTRELLEELESTEKLYGYDGDRLISYDGEECSYNSAGVPVTYRGKPVIWRKVTQLIHYNGTVFEYDGFGRRIKKGNIRYYYDNEGKLIKQSNGIQYIYDKSGVSGFRYEKGEYIYRKNAQGDITHIVDYCENVVAEYAYDAWGNCTIVKDTAGVAEVNPFRYRGYYYDVETGLYYLKTRYYDPEVGRFISQDDVSYLDPNSINGLNLYAYCLNNPIMGVDPTGTFVLSAILIGLIAGAVVGAIIGGTVAGVTAYNNGARGWELFGWTMLGIGCGAVIGGAIGAAIGAVAPAVGSFMGSASSAIGSFLSSTFVIGTTASGAAVAVTGSQIVGGAVALGAVVWFAQWEPGKWPGDDPTVPPGDGFIWRGPGEVGSEFGEWYNPATGDQLHPDLNHPLPKGGHWGWRKFRRFIQDIFKLK